MSSYKDHTTRDTKMFKQKKQKGKNLEDTQTTKKTKKKTKDTNMESTYLRRWNMDKRQDGKGKVNRSSVMVINCK